MIWDSNQYLKFEKERTQPCLDLLSRLDGNFNKILDLGCGPGNSTKKLLKTYPEAKIIGFDSDKNMLKKAKSNYPNIEFTEGFAPADLNKLNTTFDLIFSNACIHWIKEQRDLIDRVHELLNDNGIFAAQLPLTDESKFYKILYNIIDSKHASLKSAKKIYNLNPREYYNTLIKSFKSVIMWKSDYYHVVKKEMVLEWYKGSGLRPYLSLLNATEQTDFLNDLSEAINREYAELDDNNVFLVMPRLFFIAQK